MTLVPQMRSCAPSSLLWRELRARAKECQGEMKMERSLWPQSTAAAAAVHAKVKEGRRGRAEVRKCTAVRFEKHKEGVVGMVC